MIEYHLTLLQARHLHNMFLEHHAMSSTPLFEYIKLCHNGNLKYSGKTNRNGHVYSNWIIQFESEEDLVEFKLRFA